MICDVSSDWLLEVSKTGGNWFRVWERRSASGLKRALKRLAGAFVSILLRTPVRRPALPRGLAYFTSNDRWKRYLAAGVPVQSAEVIRSGISLEKFRYAPEKWWDGPIHLLYLSRFKRRKGLHTLVIALSSLPELVRLRAVGAVDDEAYLAEVAALGRAGGVMDRIELGSQVAHSEVPALMASAHVLALPSEEPEAFSRMVLESFAVGTPVVGTTLGGTGEVLIEGRTGLTFRPGHATELARQVKRLLADEALRGELVKNARKLVEGRYALGYTVDQIERLLRRAAAPGGG